MEVGTSMNTPLLEVFVNNKLIFLRRKKNQKEKSSYLSLNNSAKHQNNMVFVTKHIEQEISTAIFCHSCLATILHEVIL